jgi:hypothetical protein
MRNKLSIKINKKMESSRKLTKGQVEDGETVF